MITKLSVHPYVINKHRTFCFEEKKYRNFETVCVKFLPT